jgi:putative AdoMet-dependent methyltransferase
MDRFYDMIAKDYDQLIQDDVSNQSFPYAAYEDIQNIIASYVSENQQLDQAKILDLGIGTASLYERIIPEKYTLTGIDNSNEMLELAKLRFSEVQLYNHDLLKGLPEAIKNEKYDYIIISYVFKHFDLDYVVNMINQLGSYLAPFGKILIGDIMFSDEIKQKLHLDNHPENKNPGYFYHNFQDIVRKTDDIFALSFMEINEYSGILIIDKYYERSLHFEETLVKYKSNTEKWKSSQSQKKRE